MEKTIEELLSEPCWIIDILPKQVPKDSAGQYFAIEQYYLDEPQLAIVKQKHINVILKLNCYRDIFLEDKVIANPPPVKIADEMRKRHLCFLVDESAIVSEPNDTYMTVFNPDEQLLELLKAISAGEGLFVWKP